MIMIEDLEEPVQELRIPAVEELPEPVVTSVFTLVKYFSFSTFFLNFNLNIFII
jgi:hypothetical protein